MSVSFYAGSLELNMSNDNTAAMLGLLGLPVESVGRADDLAWLRRRILQLLNSPRARALAGLHDEYVQRKLLELDELAREAQYLQQPLTWE